MTPWGAYWEFSIGFIILVIILVIILIYTSLKKDEIQDLRCPECNFLVGDAEDAERYGNVCPDCRTDWRVNPLKKE